MDRIKGIIEDYFGGIDCDIRVMREINREFDAYAILDGDNTVGEYETIDDVIRVLMKYRDKLLRDREYWKERGITL
jgi:hypothetical protein